MQRDETTVTNDQFRYHLKLRAGLVVNTLHFVHDDVVEFGVVSDFIDGTAPDAAYADTATVEWIRCRSPRPFNTC